MTSRLRTTYGTSWSRRCGSRSNAYIAAGWSFLDDLIDPAETRSAIIRGLEIGERKTVERPWRKHGVLPV